MPANNLLNQLWSHEKASYGLRVLVALSATVAYCVATHALGLVPAMFLGIIASALAETDDNWWGRTKSVLLMLLCFAASIAATTALFPHPWPFVAGLALASFGSTLIGALGQRYASIGTATVTIALYALLGLDRHHDTDFAHALQTTLPLLYGAAWYGVLSIAWTRLFANRPIREKLGALFFALQKLLRAKADLFEPVHDADHHALRVQLAQRNNEVVGALNEAKHAIMARFGRSGRPGVQSGLYFRLYFLAQDLHERASSSHYPYAELGEAFFHSDVMYRFRRLIALQGEACAALGEAIRLRVPFAYPERARKARLDLAASMDWLRAHVEKPQQRLLPQLDLLERNLRGIEQQMLEAVEADSTLDNIDTRLRDSSPHTPGEMATRIRQQLTPKSLLFRHGLRMALALAAGYVLLQNLHTHNGYWILMTTAFVCRPNFGATRLRLVQRIVGTLIGVALTWAFMQLFPGTALQLLLASVAALVFFLTRTDRYVAATASITVMALLCFNLIGDGFVLLWPRLLDTLIGCAIAALASLFILPDWGRERLHAVAANVLDSSARYLDAVLAHYREDRRDDLAWRIARRDMHNADAALSALISSMLREPAQIRERSNLDAGFRFLALSNTLLSYLSALGAHREKIDTRGDGDERVPFDRRLLDAAGQQVQAQMRAIAGALRQRTPVPAGDADGEAALIARLEHVDAGAEDERSLQRLVRNQLALVLRMLPSLREAAAALGAGATPEK